MQPNTPGAVAPAPAQSTGSVGRPRVARGGLGLATAAGPQGSQFSSALPLWDGGLSLGTHVLTRLSVSCLSYLSSHPGASGTQVCQGLGVRHLSQVSRLLGRLEAKGLCANQPGARGNAWTLTPEGREVLNQAQPVWETHAGAQTDPIFTPSIPAQGARL